MSFCVIFFFVRILSVKKTSFGFQITFSSLEYNIGIEKAICFLNILVINDTLKRVYNKSYGICNTR